MKTTPYSPSATVILLCLGLLAEVAPSAIASESEALTSDRPTIAAAAAERSAKRDQLLREADKAAIDQKKEVGAVASALRYEEGRMRLLAELLSEGPVNDRALKIAFELRGDTSIPAINRLEVARLLQFAERKGRKFADREEWQIQCEKDAQQLVREFPEEQSAHEGLLRVAMASSGPRSLSLARELAESTATDEIKRVAAEIIERQAITGRNIRALLEGIEGSEILISGFEGKRVVFYTWAPEEERSMARALQIAKAVKGGAVIVGINLGRDANEAMRVAQARGLPGQQLYGARGYDSPLVRCLLLTLPALTYAVETDGTVKNISAERDLGMALANFN